MNNIKRKKLQTHFLTLALTFLSAVHASAYNRQALGREKERGTEAVAPPCSHEFIMTTCFWSMATAGVVREWLHIYEDATALQTKNGTPVVHIAAAYARHPEALRTFLQAGADPNAVGPQGYAPIFKAVGFNSNPEVGRVILQEGGDVNAVDPQGVTPIFIATTPGHVRMLAEQGANLRAKDSGNTEPLLSAVYNKKSPAVIGALLDARAPDTKYQYAWGALHYAIQIGSHPDTLRVLAGKTDPTYRDQFFKTPLFHAVEKKLDIKIIQALIEGGGKKQVNVADDFGDTPYCLAENYDDPAIANYLKSKGGVCDY